METKPPISHHLFLFPFRWSIDFHRSTKNKTFSGEKILNDFDKILINNDKSEWKRQKFSFTTNSEPSFNYNEYTYFYDFMRPALYDTEIHRSEPVNYYEYVVGPKAKFTIKAKEKTNYYALALTGISLHVFETGVAVLTYSLLNTQYESVDDILLINQIGRRLYPEFLGSGDNPLEAPLMSNYIAESITLELDNSLSSNKVIKETFEKFRNPEHLWSENEPFSVPMPAYVTNLFFEDTLSFTADNFEQNLCNKDTKTIINCQPIMDDRMFVLCWYGNDSLANKLKNYSLESETFQYENDKSWYAFIFCDHDKNWPSCTHPRMLKEHIREATYERWASYGTLFGLTRDTFMVLTASKKNLPIPIDQHVSRIYYQIAILCLVQRATLLQFKRKVGVQSKQVLTAVKGQVDEKTVDEIGQLYLRYLDFMNRLFYREITSQIQGDDLYNKLQTQMRIHEEVEVLDRELSELHSHVETLQTRNISRAINILTPLSIVSLFFGFVGIDKFAAPWEPWERSNRYLFYTVLLVVATAIAIVFAKQILYLTQKMDISRYSFLKIKKKY